MMVRDNRLYLGGIEAQKLVDEFSSPLYVYEEATIRERAREIQNAIDYVPKQVKYSCKANTNIEIMKIIKEEGLGIDTVSRGEVFASLEAGFDPSQILFTANNVSWDEVEYALSKDILINIDSLSQMEQFGKRYPGGEITVRINPNIGAGHHNHCITGGPESKFGVNYDRVADIKRIAKEYGLIIRGVHQHIGSGILDPEKFIMAMKVLLDVARNIDGLDFIDFGGGIGVPYRDSEERIDIELLGGKITEEFEKFCKEYGKSVILIIEPGRYLVAESGFLLATVIAVKNESNHRFVGIDTGFNHLVRPAMYGSYHEILHAGNAHGESTLQTVAGNLCESGDTFTRDEEGIVDRDLPVFNEGDVVCICTAGAYGYSMASQYNSRPRPAEVLVHEGRARLIRRRETLEDIFRSSLEI
ncbi:MAG: diaminopimelate decarboxylase [Spirochaetota bacterium]|nr:MAG: diaminopimelate decarboxylase [Spirochaetota bacterium]